MQYIKNDSRRLKTYVANRVSEIRDVSQASQWKYCPGSLNPAHDASRGPVADQLLSSERWFGGPAFLLRPEEEWPPVAVGTLSEDDPEVKNGEGYIRTDRTRQVERVAHEVLVLKSATAKDSLATEVQSLSEMPKGGKCLQCC